MQLENLTVEVRDKTLKRVGAFTTTSTNFQMEVPHNNVGTWKAVVPAGTALAEALRTPGSGVIVYNDTDVIMSGPTLKPQFLATAADPAGTITFEGVTDSIILADMLAWPQPSNGDITTQAVQQDVRSGAAETLLHAFVNANIGPAAPVSRRNPRLTMGANGGRGAVTKKAARFEALGEILGGIAKVADLGFRVVQRGSALVFETYAVEDRTKAVRLDVRNNTLSAQKLTIAAPDITHAVVIGKGPDAPAGATAPPPRSLHLYTSSASLTGMDDWGRRIERVINATSTEDSAELAQAGAEALAEKGFTAVSVQVAPQENIGMAFLKDWRLGDRVSVVVDDVEYVSVVTAFQLRADSTGFYLGAGLGDPAEFNTDVALRKRVSQTGNRISALERNG